jgi:hypothetical protein
MILFYSDYWHLLLISPDMYVTLWPSHFPKSWISMNLLHYLQILQSIQAFLWILKIEVLRLDPNTVQVQTNKISRYGICLVSPPLIPVLVFSSWVEDLHLDYKHVISNLVLETIDYLVHLSYPTVLEYVTLSTSHHSIQQGFAKDYAFLSTDQQ